jgi:hypothetical protein
VQIGSLEVGIVEISAGQIETSQTGADEVEPDVGVVGSPPTPRRHTLMNPRHVFLTRHCASLWASPGAA